MIVTFVAIGLNRGVAHSQEAPDSIVKEAEAIKTEPEAKVESPDNLKQAEKPSEETPEAAKSEPAKDEKSQPAENLEKSNAKDEAKLEDKPKNADKPKPAKEKKPEPPQPKKLPRLGTLTGPMLPGQPWRVHDLMRPRPAVVTPGELSTYDKPGTPPSDAIVLFDGTDLNNWCHVSPDPGSPDQMLEAQWKVENGYFEVAPNTGALQTIDNFGSCQFHIEWQAPSVVKGDSQGRGNSGVYFMGEFEVQVLDSYNNRTYADGQAGALYGQYPPMVNASRKPGEWQVYDILFQAPKFSLDGKLERPACVTVIHNGIFLHNAQQYVGKSGGGVFPKYDPISPAAPIRLQDHGNPVRFRNVWVRPLID